MTIHPEHHHVTATKPSEHLLGLAVTVEQMQDSTPPDRIEKFFKDDDSVGFSAAVTANTPEDLEFVYIAYQIALPVIKKFMKHGHLRLMHDMLYDITVEETYNGLLLLISIIEKVMEDETATHFVVPIVSDIPFADILRSASNILSLSDTDYFHE